MGLESGIPVATLESSPAKELPMRFRCLAASAALGLLPSIAVAQEECPDGDWFCENQQEGGGEPAGDAAEGESKPADESKSDAEKEGPPLVVYTPKGSQKPSKVIVVEKPPPKPAKPRKV